MGISTFTSKDFFCRVSKIGNVRNWLVVWNMAFIFPYIGNNDPNWLSYFSEEFKPPTRKHIITTTFNQSHTEGIPNHPKLDHFTVDTHGDLGIPHFKKPPYCVGYKSHLSHCFPVLSLFVRIAQTNPYNNENHNKPCTQFCLYFLLDCYW